jgi:hypothetical protein
MPIFPIKTFANQTQWPFPILQERGGFAFRSLEDDKSDRLLAVPPPPGARGDGRLPAVCKQPEITSFFLGLQLGRLKAGLPPIPLAGRTNLSWLVKRLLL